MSRARATRAGHRHVARAPQRGSSAQDRGTVGLTWSSAGTLYRGRGFGGMMVALAPNRCGRAAIMLAAAVSLSALSLSACAVGPNFVPPEAPPVGRYTKEPLQNPSAADNIRTRQGGSADQSFVSGADIPGQWWTLFHSKALNQLVEQALANNPNLEAAQASLRIAQQNVLAQKGTLYPSLSATPQAQGVLAPGLDLQSPLNNESRYLYSLYTPQAVVSYNPDVFGGNRRQIESLEATTENQRFQLEAAYLSLTGNVVAAAIQEAALRAQIDATRKVIQAQTEVLQLFNKQLSLGQIAGADVVQQQAALALSQQLLPPLEKQLAQQRNLLTALAGRLPSNEIAETFQLSALRLPTRLPVSLPSRLVQQRPDVKAAEALVQQASASVGVAVANRLPQFSLTATGGSSAVRLAQVANPGAAFFTIIGQATAPIFDAGTLFRRQRAAEETLTQAQAQYKATVITAFQNVADALRALQADAKAVAAADAAVSATNQSLGLIRKQYTAGAVTSTQVLIAQQGYLSALVTSAAARATQYGDSAALFVALGGGWWNRNDVAPPPPETDPLKFL